MKVVDVTTSIAGPYCAEILAALGAEVVKVERPDTGDDGRAWGPPFWNGESAMFLSVNAGKRSLAVSLADERGRAVVLRLAEQADVFLQSLRPGLADRIGLGPGRVRARSRRLTFVPPRQWSKKGQSSDHDRQGNQMPGKITRRSAHQVLPRGQRARCAQLRRKSAENDGCANSGML